jgi:hypothetical protein
VLGQFFGYGFGEFGTEMPEKRLAPGTQQAHEAVANQNEAGQFEKSFGDEFLFHKIVMRGERLQMSDAERGMSNASQRSGQNSFEKREED